MSSYGLLVDYKYCTGCHSCEVACKKELGLSEGQYGIQVFQMGPWKTDEGKWVYNFIPVPTDQCNLCESRLKSGRLPTCVHHCQSMCIEYGEVDELSKKAGSDYQIALYVPKQ